MGAASSALCFKQARLQSNYACLRIAATIPGVYKIFTCQLSSTMWLSLLFSASYSHRAWLYVWLQSRQSSGGELGGGSESVVHARVSQVVVEVLDGALACTASDPAQIIDPISSQPHQKAIKLWDRVRQYHAMLPHRLNASTAFLQSRHMLMRRADQSSSRHQLQEQLYMLYSN